MQLFLQYNIQKMELTHALSQGNIPKARILQQRGHRVPVDLPSWSRLSKPLILLLGEWSIANVPHSTILLREAIRQAWFRNILTTKQAMNVDRNFLHLKAPFNPNYLSHGPLGTKLDHILAKFSYWPTLQGPGPVADSTAIAKLAADVIELRRLGLPYHPLTVLSTREAIRRMAGFDSLLPGETLDTFFKSMAGAIINPQSLTRM